MQKVSSWTKEKVIEFLKDYFGLEDWQIDEYYGRIQVPASSEHPSIYYDDISNNLVLEYPDEYEELPNPSSARFYPDIEEEYTTVEDVKRFIREELGEDALREAEKVCANVKEEAEPGVWYRRGDPYYDCLVEQAYDMLRERLEEELEKEVTRLEESPVEHLVLCGVPVRKKTDVYEYTASDWVTEYTAYAPSTVFVIDLDKVPDEETLECILDNLPLD